MATIPVSTRKEKLKKKFCDLHLECETAVNHIQHVRNWGTLLVRELLKETDGIFLGSYAQASYELDKLINIIAQLNCKFDRLRANITCDGNDGNFESSKAGIVRQKSCAVIKDIVDISEIQFDTNPRGIVDNNKCLHPTLFKILRQHNELVIPQPWFVNGTILDMVYLHGDSPWGFWLRNYNTKCVDKIRNNLLLRHESGKLRKLDACDGQLGYVCCYDGDNYFRGKVISQDQNIPSNFLIRDVDTGHEREICESQIWLLDEDISKDNEQAIYCRLNGELGDKSLWSNAASLIFKDSLVDHTLVVTICEELHGDPLQYVVEIDSHNTSNSIKIDVCDWIISTVIPTLHTIEEVVATVESLSLQGKNGGYSIPSEIESTSPAEDLKMFNFMTDINDINVHDLKTDLIEWDSPNEENFVPSIKAKSKDLANIKNIDVLTISDKSCEEILKNSEYDWCPDEFDKFCNEQEVNMDAAQREALKLKPKEPSISDHDKQDTPNLLTCALGLAISKPRVPTSKLELPASKLEDPLGLVSKLQFLQEVGYSDCTFSLDNHLEFPLFQRKEYFKMESWYDVMLSHIEHPGEFYIHLVCEENVEMDVLHQQMLEFYSTNITPYKSKTSAMKDIHKYCACFCPIDGSWYRGNIVDWNLADLDGYIVVRYEDFGSKIEASLDMIQPLQEQFTTLSVCSLRCHLSQIIPPNSEEEEFPTWPDRTISALREFINFQDVYSIFIPYSESITRGNSLPVLLKEASDGSPIINFELVQLGCAKLSNVSSTADAVNLHHGDTDISTPISKENDALKHWDPMKEDYNAVTNTYDYDDEDACVATMGYRPKDDILVCKYFDRTGRCPKGVSCTRKHIHQNPDGWTTDQEFVYVNAFSELKVPQQNGVVVVEVTHVESVNLFYVSICKDKSVAESKTEDGEDEEETLDSLNAYLNLPSSLAQLKRPSIVPAIGQLVVALYKADQKWYRAKVIEATSADGLMKVFYVDYGNMGWVNESQVLEMKPQYLHLPFQVIECELATFDTEAMTFAERQAATSFLKKLIVGNVIHAIVVDTIPSLNKMFVLLISNEGVNISDYMVEKGYGSIKNLVTSPVRTNYLPG